MSLLLLKMSLCKKPQKHILKIKIKIKVIKIGSSAFSEIDKGKTFKNHLSKKFTSHHDITPDQSYLNKITNFSSSPLPLSFFTKHTSPNQIKNLTQNLKTK